MTPSAKPCPICRKPRGHALRLPNGRPQENPYHPFCSQRCKDRDLARWFSDSYAVPGAPADPDALASNDRHGED